MTPKAVVDAIEAQLQLVGEPRQLRDAIERVLLDAGTSAAGAAEETDRLVKKVAREISRRFDGARQMGNVAVLQLRGSNDDIVHGSSYIFSDDAELVKKIKLSRACVVDIYEQVRKLDFSEFEQFGRCVLKELGCRDPKVTQHAGDQGIDFYGDLTVGSLLGAHEGILKLMHETRVVIVGQAKHYPDPKKPIGPSTVRELVGALSLSRTATYSKDEIDLLDDVQLRPFTPVLALLFSTGQFTKGARHLASRAGLIAFSGWQIAVFLADRGVGLVEHGDLLQFDAVAFRNWLA